MSRRFDNSIAAQNWWLKNNTAAQNRRLIMALTGVHYALQLGLVVVCYSLAPASARGLDAVLSVAIAVVLGVADIAIARYLIKVLQHAKQSYAAQVSELLDQSLESYRQMAKQDEALSQEIGASVAAELASARRALAEGRAADVGQHLNAGLDAASQLRSAPCENVTVAAVLESKARQFRDAGVQLDARVSLLASIGLPDVEVAALLFNLMDNALHECQALLAEGVEQPAVTVTAMVQVGQLLIVVQNPCREGLDLRTRSSARLVESGQQHGWGTQIVRSIVNDNGGIVEFENAGGVFTARVMIPLPAAT